MKFHLGNSIDNLLYNTFTLIFGFDNLLSRHNRSITFFLLTQKLRLLQCHPPPQPDKLSWFYAGFQEDNGGVSEFLKVANMFPYLSPFTDSAWTMFSSSSISSGVSFTDKAPMF